MLFAVCFFVVVQNQSEFHYKCFSTVHTLILKSVCRFSEEQNLNATEKLSHNNQAEREHIKKKKKKETEERTSTYFTEGLRTTLKEGMPTSKISEKEDSPGRKSLSRGRV